VCEVKLTLEKERERERERVGRDKDLSMGATNAYGGCRVGTGLKVRDDT